MAEAGFLEPKRVRPGSAAAVILIHGAAIAALLLAKGEIVVPRNYTPLRMIPIPDRPDPPPIPEPPPRDPRQALQPQTFDLPIPANPPLRPAGPTVSEPPAPPPPAGTGAGPSESGGAAPRPAPDPPIERPAPVRIAATLVSGDLQPPYPASEQRLEREGTVVIRVTVGTDGRVIATEKVRATSDAFYEATERHARARWRFRPATLDGRPVEARKTVTVHFRLDG